MMAIVDIYYQFGALQVQNLILNRLKLLIIEHHHVSHVLNFSCSSSSIKTLVMFDGFIPTQKNL
jgi:hypothetical protein